MASLNKTFPSCTILEFFYNFCFILYCLALLNRGVVVFLTLFLSVYFRMLAVLSDFGPNEGWISEKDKKRVLVDFI